MMARYIDADKLEGDLKAWKEKLWDTKFNAAPWVEAANYLLERLADVPANKIVTAKDRVEEERMQLAERLDKLIAFLGSEKRSEISGKQYNLLLMQRNVMEQYLMILSSRLVNWGEE